MADRDNLQDVKVLVLSTAGAMGILQMHCWSNPGFPNHALA